MAEHRVGLVELFNAASDDVGTEAKFLRKLFLLLAIVRNELVQRWIDEADGHRESIHCFKYADEVAALERQELIQSFNSGFLVVGQNHFLDGALTLLALLGELEIGEEHVLGAAKADTFRPELACFAGVLRRV